MGPVSPAPAVAPSRPDTPPPSEASQADDDLSEDTVDPHLRSSVAARAIRTQVLEHLANAEWRHLEEKVWATAAKECVEASWQLGNLGTGEQTADLVAAYDALCGPVLLTLLKESEGDDQCKALAIWRPLALAFVDRPDFAEALDATRRACPGVL